MAPRSFFVVSDPERTPTLRPGVLQVALFDGFPPFTHRQNGLLGGSDIELLNKFANGEGLTAVFRFHKFQELWDLVEDEAYDMAAGGIGIRRNWGVKWSEPYASVRRTGLIVGQNKPYIRGYDDVKRIGVVASSAAHDHAFHNGRVGTEVLEVESLQGGVEALLGGNIEMLGAGNISARYLKSQWPMLEIVDLHGRGSEEPVAFAVRNSPLLLRKLNQFLVRRQSGTKENGVKDRPVGREGSQRAEQRIWGETPRGKARGAWPSLGVEP